jgi:hypothetical protein
MRAVLGGDSQLYVAVAVLQAVARLRRHRVEEFLKLSTGPSSGLDL